MSRPHTPPTTDAGRSGSSLTAITATAAVTFTVLFAFALTFSFMGTAQAAAVAVPLGTADSYAVLAGSAVTNTGPSVINGDLGVNPGTAVTGIPPGLVNGSIHAGDPGALQAQTDLTTAYNQAAAEQPPIPVTGDLGGRSLTAGVYNSATSLGLTGALTLNGQGNPDSVWVFQAGSTLTTATASNVILTNGANLCNVYWQIGSSATLGTNSTFQGNILALTSISVNTNVTVQGRVLARNGAVTLDNDRINRPDCSVTTPPTTSAPPTTSPTASPTTSPTSAPPTSLPSAFPSGPGHHGGHGGHGGHGNGPPGQITHVPNGPPATGDGGSIHRSHPIVAATGILALGASMAALFLWRRERRRA